MACRTVAAESCGIMRAVSAADIEVPCAKMPAYTITATLSERGSRPSMIQLSALGIDSKAIPAIVLPPIR